MAKTALDGLTPEELSVVAKWLRSTAEAIEKLPEGTSWRDAAIRSGSWQMETIVHREEVADDAS